MRTDIFNLRGLLLRQRNKAVAKRDDEIAALRRRVERLDAALTEIRDSEFCSYVRVIFSNDPQYEIGVTDGHRYCSSIARKALEKDNGETPRKTVAQVAKEWGEKPINKYIDTELVDPVFAKGYTQGLEDAARECSALFESGQSGLYGNGCLDCAAAIRALQKTSE